MLQQIVTKTPSSILGDIWFSSLPPLGPLVSLRLAASIADVIKRSSEEILIKPLAPAAGNCLNELYTIQKDSFLKLIQRDGYGGTIWNETEGSAFVSVEVVDEKLIADFFNARNEIIDAEGC